MGSASYDIGHFLGTSGGGYALVGVAGRDGQKGSGASCWDQNNDDSFAIDYLAHEMGHQFGANHTFNSACDGQNYRNADSCLSI